MCGIIGYWNTEEDAFETLGNSLKNLEYRGYDSFGFATTEEKELFFEKNVGKPSSGQAKKIPGKIGIGHTRWATHGKVTEKNTHPHFDCKKQIAVAHNGIVENFQELKKDLEEKGHYFSSETDTEVIPHLIEEQIKEGFTLRQAVINSGKKIKGRNAFMVLDAQNEEIIAFRNGSPLIVGVKTDAGHPQFYIASDVQAFLDKTNDIVYLDDNEIVVINNEITFFSGETGDEVEKRLIKINLDSATAEKGDYEHYMLKEVMEQKESIARAINQDEEELLHVAKEINKARGIFFIGCGTAARVAHTAEYAFSMISDKHVNYITASEFENSKHFLTPESLVIAISQSGETADVIEALEVAKEKGSKIIAITNTKESSIDKMADFTFLINAGTERAVASTKATTAQIAVIILLAYACSGNLQEGKRALIEMTGKVNDMLNPRYNEHIKKLASIISNQKNQFIIGRGINYPMALESAIKIMEVSYINAQGFAGGELKHGPIALIEQDTPVIALVADDDLKHEIISNAIEVKSRGAYVIGVAPENNEAFNYWIKTPRVEPELSSLVSLIPIQLLSYYLGLELGHDIDCPRSLAKSVTVK